MYTDEPVPAGRRLVGVEAVIDKDLASALLAADFDADALLIVTDVDAVYSGWGTPEQRAIGRRRRRICRREFAAGSMGPKVKAACDFVERDRRPVAAIGSIADTERCSRRGGHVRDHRGRRHRAALRMAKRKPAFTDEERAAMKERAREQKAARAKADGESDVLAKIAELPEPDRAWPDGPRARQGERAGPYAEPWYGMPAYANDGKVVCFFQSGQNSRRGTRRSVQRPGEARRRRRCGRTPSRWPS